MSYVVLAETAPMVYRVSNQATGNIILADLRPKRDLNKTWLLLCSAIVNCPDAVAELKNLPEFGKTIGLLFTNVAELGLTQSLFTLPNTAYLIYREQRRISLCN